MGYEKASNVELSTNATCAGSGDIRQTRDRQSRQTHNQLLIGHDHSYHVHDRFINFVV
jgi:hypothetical protein